MVFRVTEQGVLRGILERGRVARSEWWRGKERGVEEPAERERVTRCVWWCGKERGVEEPAERERVTWSV